MKKLYAFTLMAAVGLSASAVTFNSEGRTLRQAIPSKTRTVHSINEMQPVQKMENGTMKIMKARKADTNTSLEGTWTFALGDYYFQNSANGTIYVDFVASYDTDGTLWFEDPTDYEFPMVATYDSKASALTFSKFNLGSMGTTYAYQVPFVYNYTTNNLDEKSSIVGEFDAENMTISFQPDNGLMVVDSYANGDPTGQGYWSIYDLEGAFMVNWVKIGQGTFLENIAYSLFAQGSNNTYADVTIYEDEVTPGVYMVEKAFSTLYSALNINYVSPSMIVDARDASDVKIELQTLGFEASTPDGNDGMVYYFGSTWFYDQFGDTLNGLVYIVSQTDNDNNVTITFPVNSCYLLIGEGIYLGSRAESVLKFKGTGSGVSSIETENGATRYFNLQGVEVKNPQPGTVVIKVADGKATKLIAR